MPISFLHHFLVAMPNMDDPRFNESVVLVAEHHAQGAMGIVVNKPTQQTFSLLCSRMGAENLNPHMAEQPVYYGGPVHPERGLVLHQPQGSWASTIKISAQSGLTHSRDCFDVLRAPTHELAPTEAMLVLGFAGWSAGQLEQEVINNDWLAVAFPPEAGVALIFNTPAEKRREQVLALMGINATQLVRMVGHG